MKLKQLEKQPQREKLSVMVDFGIKAELAELSSKFERGGYALEFDKHLNRWIKGFVKEASKAIDAVGSDSSEVTGAQVFAPNVTNFVPNQQTY